MAIIARITDRPTTESIAAAKRHLEAERERIYRDTGLRITDVPITMAHVASRTYVAQQATAPAARPDPRKPYIIRCPQCVDFAAVTRSEGRAYRALATHLVVAHVPQEVA